MPEEQGPTPAELADQAAAILDRISYMVLWTADVGGQPWTTPVYFAISNSPNQYPRTRS